MTCVAVVSMPAVAHMPGMVVTSMSLVAAMLGMGAVPFVSVVLVVLCVVVVAGVLIDLGAVVGVLLAHVRSFLFAPARILLRGQEAGCISLSTTHLWFVISMPSAS